MRGPRLSLPGLAVLSALALFGTLRAAEPESEVRTTLYVFGTLVEIVLYGVDHQTAESAFSTLSHDLRKMHAEWHAWQPGALGTLNAALAEGRTAEVDDRLADVLRAGSELSCLSHGTFDPAIGRLIALWGFHSDTPPEDGLPDLAQVDALVRAQPRMADLTIDGRRVSSANRAVQLDLGGYAKGAAMGLSADRLRAMGVENAVLNSGGDVNVIGTHGDRPWRVAIRDPFQWGAVAAVSLRPGETLYTSGNYERFFEHDGTRFAHIVDPRDGWPVRNVVSVSVLDDNGTRADAAATALSVAGRKDWPQVAADMGVTAVLMIADDGSMLATPAMGARLEMIGGTPAPDIVTLPDPVPPDC